MFVDRQTDRQTLSAKLLSFKELYQRQLDSATLGTLSKVITYHNFSDVEQAFDRYFLSVYFLLLVRKQTRC